MAWTPSAARTRCVLCVLCVLCGLALLPALSGCEVLEQVARNRGNDLLAQMPTVTYEDAVLVESPSQALMRAWYCPRVVPDPFGVPGGARVLCQGFFGAAPAESQMRVSFDLRFRIANPNHFPIPVAEMLTAATVFPGKSAQALGAACVTFCGADQPGCTGQPGPGACQAQDGDIRSIDDFRNAAVNLLIATGIRSLAGQEPEFVVPQVVADGEIVLVARFSFGPLALLDILGKVAQQTVQQLRKGEKVVFAIPYELAGTVWLDVGSLGRVAVGYGPAAGTWVIPETVVGL